MRPRKQMIAALALAAVLAACGSEKSATPTTAAATTGPATTGPATTGPMSSDLDSLRLEVGDLMAGWKIGAPINSFDLESFPQIACPDSAINPTFAERLTATSGIQFEPVDRSSKHLIELLVGGDPVRLGKDLEILFEALDACKASTVDGTDTTLTIEDLAIPELGDQRWAGTYIAAENPGSPPVWYVRSATVRVGSVAVGLSLTEILDSPDQAPSISDSEFIALLEKAVAELDTAAGS